MTPFGYIQTGQVSCHDVSGQEISCTGSGQDAAFKTGIAWPEPRFIPDENTVFDQLTSLIWTRDANLAEFPMTWQEALQWVAKINSEQTFGFSDWRLPNRRELRSLVSHQTRRPPLPEHHPFVNVFLSWYWTSTTAAIALDHAWYVSMDGARMFYGGKDQSFMVWPVRGQGNTLHGSGQKECYDARGLSVPCAGSGQDGEFKVGMPWPEPRFVIEAESVLDQLTGLRWLRQADLTAGPVSWPEALAAVEAFRREAPQHGWRLPNINELESLIDCASHTPALPAGYGFTHLNEAYWSATTSLYEPDGALGTLSEQRRHRSRTEERGSLSSVGRGGCGAKIMCAIAQSLVRH